jgi:hypothetical protein
MTGHAPAWAAVLVGLVLLGAVAAQAGVWLDAAYQRQRFTFAESRCTLDRESRFRAEFVERC